MRKSKLASLIVVGVLAVGGGVALAETAPDNPEVVEDTVTAPEVEAPEVQAPEVEAPETEAPEQEAPEVEDDAAEDGAAEHPDNHGAVVSAAAHDHSHDEACGNHGAYVSAVAKTGEEPECATAESTEGAATTAKHGKGHGKPSKKK